MQRQQQQTHVSPAAAAAAIAAAIQSQRPKKNRGSYNCGRCGLPKKGHVCQAALDMPDTPIAAEPRICPTAASPARSTVRYLPAARAEPRHADSHLRRALSFDENEKEITTHESDLETMNQDLDRDLSSDDDTVQPGVPMNCLLEVLKRLPPLDLISAARVCRGWRETTKRIWKAAKELRLRVPARTQVGYIGSLLQKCPRLLNLSLRMESDLDATALACIAFSCPDLEALEIIISGPAVNRITGDELARFVADKHRLGSLKLEGCSNLGSLVLCSSSLSTLWLSDLHSLSRLVVNCPNLMEISLEFSQPQIDSTDLIAVAGGLGRMCSRLQRIHIASVKLSHAVVLALTTAHFRELRRLSLILGEEITDASVEAISSTYSNLELLDLSGSSITDSGIGVICNVFPDTLTRLLLAFCPNITSSGIQFATAQLPFLELLDCGVTICDPTSEYLVSSEISNNPNQCKRSCNMQQLLYQKMFIKHGKLKTLSLWGCSSLDALFLNCPELKDLNVTLCNNLNPGRLVLQCPKLERVHASGCDELLIETIRIKVSENSGTAHNNDLRKSLPKGSKRVMAPEMVSPQDDDRGKRRRLGRHPCHIIVD